MASLLALTRRLWRQPAQEDHPVPSTLAVRGSVDALSDLHVAGWLQAPSEPERRIAFEAVLADTGEVVSRGIADRFRPDLLAGGIGDGRHGFHGRLSRGLSVAESASLVVRAADGGGSIARHPEAATVFEPVLYVAMDIVDNCNLRCPFCLYDYENTRATHFMTETSLQAALRFLPYTRDGEFYYSCLHEPTLHPELMRFVDQVPPQYRRKLFYTTNLAKRMPPAYFAWLAGTALHHINISIESLRPELYERMRKGARWRIFKQNWDALLTAFDEGPAPPRLRYIAMVYKSNVDEVPDLVRYLLEERRAWQVELRYTFDVAHLPRDFRESEFLDPPQWLALRDRLALEGFPPDRVQLCLPPEVVAAEVQGTPPERGDIWPTDHCMLHMSWDGSTRVVGISGGSQPGTERVLTTINVAEIDDVVAFLNEIPKLAES
jgi:hypothetical protein